MFSANPIGVFRTSFREKFGTPRQSGLVPAATGILELNPDPAYAAAAEGLEAFSHLWIIFLFDRHLRQEWRPKITPPRTELERVGVFASRSPHRPNPIGLSAVKLDQVVRNGRKVELHCSGVDILDGTPVLDIKPYVPYADAIPDARGAWASAAPVRHPVTLTEKAAGKIAQDPAYRALLEQTLALDPRPRSQRESMPLADAHGKIFRFRLGEFDVEWQVQAGTLVVLDLLSG